MQETMDMKGRLRLVMEDREGRVLLDRSHPNRIVKTGRQLAAQLFAGVTGTPPSRVSHMAVGENNSAATDDQTTLGKERARKAVAAPEYSEVIDGVTGVKRVQVRLTTVFETTEANDTTTPLCEAGIFTDSTAGTMYNRVVFDPVTKADTFRLTLIWDIVF